MRKETSNKLKCVITIPTLKVERGATPKDSTENKTNGMEDCLEFSEGRSHKINRLS